MGIIHSIDLLLMPVSNCSPCSITCEAIEETSSNHSKFVDQCAAIEDEVRQQAGSNISSIEESSKQCKKLNSRITAVLHDTEEWCEVTTNKMASAAEQQEAYFQLAKTQLTSFQKVSICIGHVIFTLTT